MKGTLQYLMVFLSGGGGWHLLSKIGRALPEPMPMGSRWYLFFYRFCNVMANNDDLVDKAK